MSKPVTDPSLRFWNKVKKTPNCWLWLGTKNKAGYGQLTHGAKRVVFAHRISYEIHKGKIPDGFIVCHTCDNPTCVNPSHLFIGTDKDNILDCISKGRHVSQKHPNCYAKGESHWCSKYPEKIKKLENNPYAKLTNEQVINICKEYKEGSVSHRQLANKYNVAKSTITSILTGHNWKKLTFNYFKYPEISS